jgi:hypothetical protein
LQSKNVIGDVKIVTTVLGVIRRVAELVRYRLLQILWARNRCSEHFDIDWNKINFNRIACINLLCAVYQSESYLEIGCAANDCFDSIIAKYKVGVDPERGGTHRLTSDQFFAENGNKQYDLIFIDGLHIYEQARRDIVNALRHVKAGGWIVLHDMFPRNWLEEHVPRISALWVGDVWKVALELARSPDVDFKILRIDHGVGILRILRQSAKIPDLRAELQAARFSYFYKNIGSLPVLDYEHGRAWIESYTRKLS